MKPSATDELGLVRRCQQGDTTAFDRLVQIYQDRIFNLVFRMVNDHEDAFDITQEIFIKAFRSIGRFQGESRFYTWLYRIALNTVISFRRHSKLCPSPISFQADDSFALSAQEMRSGTDDPSRAAESAEQREVVERAIAALDMDHRVVLLLRDIEGKNYAEIAEILKCPPGTVKSRIHRARLALKKMLGPMLGLT